MAVKYKYLAINNKLMAQHRYVLEQHLNRKLKTSELVHHLNKNGFDNNIDNLTLTTRHEHMKIHSPGKKTRFKKQHFLNKDKVYNFYHIQNKSLTQISKTLKVSIMTLQRFMKKENIDRRNNRGMRDANE